MHGVACEFARAVTMRSYGLKLGQKVTVYTIFFCFVLYYKAQAIALTIADAFKIAFINYKKGKFDGSHGYSLVAQYDNKALTQQSEAVVNNEFVDTDTSLKSTAADILNPPVIQVTEGTSIPTAEEDLTKKMQSLVNIFH